MLFILEINKTYKWYISNDLNSNILIHTIDICYTKEDIALEWLQYFINYKKNKKEERHN